MAPPTWKLLLTFGEQSEFTSRLLKSDICPCRYCWCGQSGRKHLQESFLSTFQKLRSPEEAETTKNFQESPYWKLVLTFEDGSEFTSQPLNSQTCTCRYCWCGKCGTSRLERSDLWAFQNFLSFGAANSLRQLLNRTQLTCQRSFDVIPSVEMKEDNEIKVEEGEKKCSDVITGKLSQMNMTPKTLVNNPVIPTDFTELKSERSDSDQVLDTDSEVDQESDDNRDPTWTEGESSQEIEEIFNKETQDSDQDGNTSQDSDWDPISTAAKTQSKKPQKSNLMFKPKCFECDQSFPTRPALDQHLKEHNPTHPFKCRFCPSRFRIKTQQFIHQRKHQNRNGRYGCIHCEYQSVKPRDLFRHIQQKHSSAKYDKPAVSPLNEASDDSASTKSRPYECSQCEMSFTTKNNLVKHHQTHSGERPYQCSLCPQAFFRSNNLKNHMKVHTSNRVRPHKCDQCTHSFTRTNHLRLHKQRSHGSTLSYRCKSCQTSFRQHKDLIDHMCKHQSQRKLTRDKRHQRKVTSESSSQQPTPRVSPTENLTRVLRQDDLEEPDVIVIDDEQIDSDSSTITPPPSRPFCFICSKSFHDNYNLKRHQRNVHRKLHFRKKSS